MASYKLTYFNGRGRGECARMCFAAAGKKFEDKRLEFSDWPAMKPKTPQGSMPVLEVNGKTEICQSQAVVRFLGKEFGLYGKTNLEGAIVDQIMDTCLDLFTPFIKLAFTQDEKEKAEGMKKFAEETLPKVLGFLEALMKQTGKNGFSVGASVTIADLAMYTTIETVTNGVSKATNCKPEDLLAKFPQIAAMQKTIAALPRIKEYLAKRPVTEF